MDYNNNNQQIPQEPQTPQSPQVPPVQQAQAPTEQPPITPQAQVPQRFPQRDDSFGHQQPQQQNYQPFEYAQPAKRKFNVGKLIGTLITVALIVFAVYNVGTRTGLFSFGEKTFSKKEFSIKLPSEFVEKDLMSQTAYYESRTSIVSVLKEDFSMFEKMGIKIDTYTLKDYAKLVLKVNNTSATIKEVGNLTTFEYKKTVQGKNFSYFATVHKGSDAFWLVQFSSETKNYNRFKSKFEKWAKTIDID